MDRAAPPRRRDRARRRRDRVAQAGRRITFDDFKALLTRSKLLSFQRERGTDGYGVHPSLVRTTAGVFFQHADSNHDEKVSREGLARMFKAHGLGDAARAERYFERFDLDKSGELDKKEFTRLLLGLKMIDGDGTDKLTKEDRVPASSLIRSVRELSAAIFVCVVRERKAAILQYSLPRPALLRGRRGGSDRVHLLRGEAAEAADGEAVREEAARRDERRRRAELLLVAEGLLDEVADLLDAEEAQPMKATAGIVMSRAGRRGRSASPPDRKLLVWREYESGTGVVSSDSHAPSASTVASRRLHLRLHLRLDLRRPPRVAPRHLGEDERTRGRSPTPPAASLRR